MLDCRAVVAQVLTPSPWQAEVKASLVYGAISRTARATQSSKNKTKQTNEQKHMLDSDVEPPKLISGGL